MQERPLLIRADRVFDGTARPPLEGGFVLLHEGRVAAIGARGDDMPACSDVETFEFPGCTVMPGLIDSHVHLSFSAGAAPLRELQGDSDAAMLLRAAANARAALQAGVTTLRDLGSRNRVALDLRDAVAAGVVPGPRILACGRPITCPGGHCHFLGGVAQGVDEVAALTHELIAEGVDVVKVMATGGNMTASSDPLHAQFTVEEIRAAVEVAHAADRRVTVHARGVEGMRRSLEAGVDGIEHARMEVAPGEWGFDEALARAMAARGVTAAPTFAASFRAFQCREAGAEVGVRAGAVPIPIRQKNAARLRECGVPVVAGSDAGAALARFDEAIHLELELLVGAGWTPAEALRAATSGSAVAIGRSASLGSLVPGKVADLTVVRGDPTRDITHARQVQHVFAAGVPVVEDAGVRVDARPSPWPDDAITERRSLLEGLPRSPA